jgi:hypothetical protein
MTTGRIVAALSAAIVLVLLLIVFTPDLAARYHR